ncbi:DUF1648 domain-containing protein [Ornithinibacillus sp. L9]|uniref:DUF1648 domain-containing protein n=1 Tax=Ornithinibacillus caprae TaxID=2678566 RepID=A0A6N8FRF5_9BACI|nr:DUF1648 domain-containing protein [Ornithinibacillus caprae]MUK90368.1 DUF1648 domain-containing protein [Ornithinibacillus caprae]
MIKHPKIPVPKTLTEKIHDISAVVIILGMIITTFIYWRELPQQIAIHFTQESPDQFGGKWVLLLNIAIAIIIYTLTRILARFPHLLNYPGHVTEENAVKFYKNGKLLISWINIEIVLIFALIHWKTIQISLSENSFLDSFNLLIGFVGIILTMFIFLIRIMLIK